MKESLSVCLLIFLTTAHPIDFKLCTNIAEDQWTCSVDCEVFWMSGSQESFKHMLPDMKKKVQLNHEGNAPAQFAQTQQECIACSRWLKCKDYFQSRLSYSLLSVLRVQSFNVQFGNHHSIFQISMNHKMANM